MNKTEIKSATVEELSKRLIEIKNEELEILIELWSRAPKETRIPKKQLLKELKNNGIKKC